MNQLILVGAETIDFHLLLNRLLMASGFDPALTRDPDEIVGIAVERKPHIIMLAWKPRSFPVAEIQARLKQDDRTAAIPIAALADPQQDSGAPPEVGTGPDGYWMRRNGRYVRLDPTEYSLLRRLSRRSVRGFLSDELVDSAWWHDIRPRLAEEKRATK